MFRTLLVSPAPAPLGRVALIAGLLALAGCQSGATSELERALDEFIEHEIAGKGVPALSITLVDDQKTVFAEGYGFADPEARVAATAGTVYRTGSVSKLYTGIAIMQLAEQRRLGIDAPVSDYLPAFRPENPSGKAVTLRQLMSHRSGLVREPPVGSYFDDSEPSIASIVESLSGTKLVYAPEARAKYSNAAIVAAGAVVEAVTGKPFAQAVEESIFRPLKMSSSSFLRALVADRVAAALMWGVDGREFAAPRFDVLVPAGNLYSTVEDQARFVQALFRGGGPLLKPETLAAMLEPQFDPQAGFGLSFALSRFEGRRRIGHGGAVYGFSTELAVLPEEKLGCIAAASRDVTNDVVRGICDYALRLLLAGRAGADPPEAPMARPVTEDVRRQAAGEYASDSMTVRLVDRGEDLWLDAIPYPMVRIRERRGAFVTDWRTGSGTAIELGDGTVTVDGVTYRRREDKAPPAAPREWEPLIGEYGWDHNVLFILERHGRLCALIEWVFLYPLEHVQGDVWAFPDYGLYHGEHVEFRRGAGGRVAEAVAAGVGFPRRAVGTEAGETFRIEPLRPVEELRREALQAQPPAQPDGLLQPDLVEIASLDPTIKLDIRYASENNFMGAQFYTEPRAFLQRSAAEAAVRAHQRLGAHGYGLLIHDAYRPWSVTKMFYDATPDLMKSFVANPERGSVHNRGAAVDLTLYNLRTGEPADMPSGYDEFTARAYPEYPGGTSRQRYLRELLRGAMEAEGFAVYEYEWWHFDYRDAPRYPVLNVPLEEAGAL